MKNEITEALIEELFQRLGKEADESGYNLNPDIEFTKELVRSLLINENRYGYWACPCRLASGIKAKDMDIICPCDYRDADLNQFGSCFCALYVSGDVVSGKKKVGSIPERRPTEKERERMKEENVVENPGKLPVWRCKVCGYLCARDEPPEVCPICKAKRERFERFM